MAEKERSPGKHFKSTDNGLDLPGKGGKGMKLRNGKTALPMYTGTENTVPPSPSLKKASVKPSAFVQTKVEQIISTLSGNCTEMLSCIQHLSSEVFSNDSDSELKDDIVKAGIVRRLIEILGRNNEFDLRREALILIEHISEGTSSHKGALIECGAVPVLIRVLDSTEIEDAQQCALSLWALGHIACDCEAFRKVLLEKGILQPLLIHLRTNNSSVTSAGVFCLSQLCQSQLQDRSEVLSVLCNTLYNNDDDVVEQTCWGLYHFLKNARYGFQEIISKKVCQRLVDLLQHEVQDIVWNALLVIEQIVFEQDEQVKVILNCKLLHWLLELLQDWKEDLQTKICGIIALVAKGDADTIRAVIDIGIFQALNKVLKTGESEAQIAAVRAIQHAVQYRSSEFTRAIVKNGCFRPLCKLLIKDNDTIIELVLDSISNILFAGTEAACSGTNVYAQQLESYHVLNIIKSLQNHKKEEIKDTASKIISTYFAPKTESINLDSEPTDTDCSDEIDVESLM